MSVAIYLVGAILIAELRCLNVVEAESAGGRWGALAGASAEDDHVGGKDRLDSCFTRHCE